MKSAMFRRSGPQPGDRIPVCIHISSKNIDADWQRAVDAGVEVTMPLADQFWATATANSLVRSGIAGRWARK